MLILLPPSESKHGPDAGDPVDLGALSFPELTEAREAMLRRLAEASAAEDGLERLGVGPSLSEEVQRNTRLLDEPAAPALSVYTGVLYDALDADGLDAAAMARTEQSLVIVSALWGALRPADRIPAYRLSMGAKIAPRGTLASWWKAELAPVLEEAAADELIMDCRSSGYQAAWKAPAEQTVLVRAEREHPDGTRKVVSHMAKHYRGLLAREVLASGEDPRSPEELRDLLAQGHRVELGRERGGAAVLTAVVPA